MLRPIQQVGVMNAPLPAWLQWPVSPTQARPHPGSLQPPASSCRPAQARDTAPRLTAAAFPALNIVSILLEAGLGPLASGTLDASPRTAQQGQQASVQVRGKETQAFIFPIVKNLRISIIRKYFLTQDAYFKAPSFCRMVSK